MAETSLVGPDIQLGEEILAALDTAKFPVTVAFWLRGTEEDDWNLVVSTPRYRDGDVRLQLVRAVRDVVTGDIPVRLKSNHDPMIRDIRKTFGKMGAVRGIRLAYRTLGGTFINDGYVYRIK